MQPAEHLEALRRDGAAFADACETAGLESPVPSCPGWSVGDLVWHLSEVHDFWRAVVAERMASPDSYVQPPRPAPDDLLAGYRAGLDRTVDTLSAAAPSQVNWTWSSDHSAAFVQRRMAQETAVHLADACSAAGRPMAVEAALASDGVDEFLEHFHSWPSEAPSAGGSVHLHCTDVPGEWTVREVQGQRVVSREHAKGDCALRGAASDLLLVLWRRLPLSAADVVGDADVAARFVAYTRLD